MKSFTSIVGWLLLVALIAIPSFLFYNWYSKARATEAATASQQQGVPAGSLFAGSDRSAGSDSAADRAPRPGSWAQPPRPAGSPATAAQAPAPEPAVSKVSSVTLKPVSPPAAPAVNARNPAPAAVSAPAPAAAPAPAVASIPAPAAVSQGGGASGPINNETAPAAIAASSAQASGAVPAPKPAGQGKPASYFSPKSERDPTLSPDDYQKIKDDEQQRQDRIRQAKLSDMKKKKVDAPEAKLKLQGIVGNRVIINGDSYAVGNTVMGAKILKIGSDYIIGEFKGKKFKKILQ